MDKILLTGKSGFLGNYLYAFLKSKYKDVDTLGRHKEDNINGDFLKGNFQINKSYDMVVHSAGLAHIVPRNEREKKLFYEINYHGTERLLQALEIRIPKYFVFISSIAVYGLNAGIEINEITPLKATEPYGKSKVLAEKAVMDWCEKNNCIYSILRLPLIAGINPPGNLGAMIKGIKSRKYFRIGGGGAKKSIVLATDVATIVPKVAVLGGIYNLTDTIHPSFKQIEDTLCEKFNASIFVLPNVFARIIGYFGDIVNFIMGKRKFPLDSRAYQKITQTLTLDDSKAQAELGWKPKSVLSFIKDEVN